MGHVSPLNNTMFSLRRSCTMSMTVDFIYFLPKIGILSVLESNKIVFGPGAPNPTGGADRALSDPLVDWDRVRYTVPVFLPIDAFGALVMDGPKS